MCRIEQNTKGSLYAGASSITPPPPPLPSPISYQVELDWEQLWVEGDMNELSPHDLKLENNSILDSASISNALKSAKG